MTERHAGLVTLWSGRDVADLAEDQGMDIEHVTAALVAATALLAALHTVLLDLKPRRRRRPRRT